MTKIVDLDAHRPPRTLPEDANILCCNYCGGSDLVLDTELDLYCSNCLAFTMGYDGYIDIIFKLELDDEK